MFETSLIIGCEDGRNLIYRHRDGWDWVIGDDYVIVVDIYNPRKTITFKNKKVHEEMRYWRD